ncbi:MAG: hypothetical protein K2X82_10020 [Gemmataceae bacterium]|nr:hypothetical protein [Gemmataceae bacterium]
MSPLTTLLSRAGWPDPVVDAEAVAGWPPGTLDRLAALGLLAGYAGSAACDACGADHVEPVQWVHVDGLPPRAFIGCPEYGPVKLDPAGLRRWTVRLSGLVAAVAETGGFAGGVAEVRPGRAWRLGKTQLGDRPWVAYLARGLGWPDAATVLAELPALRAAGAVVLVPAVVPRAEVWGGGPAPPVVPLADLLALTDAGVTFDRAFLAAAVDGRTAPAGKAPAVTFPTPAGVGWADVALAVGPEELTARAGGVTRRYRFADIGFADGRRADSPDRVWALLRLFAAHAGVLPSRPDGGAGVPDRIKQTVRELNRRLRALFQLDAPPVTHDPKAKEYRTQFAVARADAATVTVPPWTGWEDVTLTEVAGGVVEVTVAGPGGPWSRRHPLRGLGLADAHDATTPAGRALLDVLRSGGAVRRKPTDRGMLALNRRLTDLFGLPDPFAIDPAAGRWAARFAAASRVGENSPAGRRHPANDSEKM